MARDIRISWVGGVALLLCIGLSSCGVLTWRDVYVAEQPTGSGKLRVREQCGFSDCTVQIVVSQGWHSRHVERYGGCIIRFAHAVWAGSRVAAAVDGSTQQIAFAYDLETNQAIPFSSLQAPLQAAIMGAYRIRPEELAPTKGIIFVGPHESGLPNESPTTYASATARRTEFPFRYPDIHAF